jgi:hypothetical protein
MSTGLGQAKLQANMMSQQVTGHSECIHVDKNIGSKARRSVCMYFPQDLLFNCDKYDELRKTLFHKIKSLLCPNVNLNSFKNELNTHLVDLFLQGSDDLSIVIFRETTSKFIIKLCMGSYCGPLYKIVVSIGNAKITSSWNMI